MSTARTRLRRPRPGTLISAVAAAAVLVTLALTGCGSSPASTASSATSGRAADGSKGAPVKVNIEIYPGSFYTWLPYLAAKKGFFAQNGLDANLQDVTGGGSVAFAALANGSSDIAMGDVTLAGPLLAKGVGLTAITGAAQSGWEVVAPKGATVPTTFPASIKALKGKNVGVVALGTSSYFYAQNLAVAAGLGKDGLTYQALGGVTANFVSALQASRVAAVLVAPDVAYYLTKDEGARLVFNLNDPGALKQAGGELAATAGYSSGWLWARNGWLQANPGAGKKFQLAMAEADSWAHNPANLSQVISLLENSGDLAAFEKGAGAAPFFRYALPMVVSYVPAGSARAFTRFWQSAGVLPASLPPQSQWLSPSLPDSAGAVKNLVKAAGQASGGGNP